MVVPGTILPSDDEVLCKPRDVQAASLSALQRAMSAMKEVKRAVNVVNEAKSCAFAAFRSISPALPANRVWAAANGGDDLLLLQYLASVPHDPAEQRPLLEYTNRQGQTPLIIACTMGHLRCLQVLLLYGANAYAQDAQGHTGLHHACIKGHYDLVQVLLTVHDPALRNREGMTAMDVCRRNIDGHRRVINSAKCLEIIEQRCKLFEGWIYESVNNLASSALRLRSLQSWVRRYGVVFSIGSPDYVEVAFFDVVDGLRTLTPRSTILFRIHDPVMLNTQRKMFNPKPFNFTITGSRKMPGVGYLGRPDLFELAAFNELEYERWTTFMCLSVVSFLITSVSMTQKDSV
ncbi:hypothetical protein ACHHYP_04002 [Achlya hypogyna]|uniref:Uncharacterized protein n=1 Tax=Achlya hypogyna TaxID=1202772 RepID=A0A1V9ZQ40_ACHHY|nr:hypothetical protein ACHHYP_04002 [Achlya hypogyna]